MKKPCFYQDATFYASQEARPLRVLSEYMGPKERLAQNDIRHTITIMGSARMQCPKEGTPSQSPMKEHAFFYEQARRLTYLLTLWAKQLPKDLRPVILTGGGPGIMEAGNRGAREAGGMSIGMAIELPYEQELNDYCTPNVSMQFHYFFTRKVWMLFYTRAFIVFPGGFGTIDEMFETLTLMQTGKLQKYPIVLFGSQFWNSMINFKQMLAWHLIDAQDLDLLHFSDTAEDAVEYLTKILTVDYLKKAANC